MWRCLLASFFSDARSLEVRRVLRASRQSQVIRWRYECNSIGNLTRQDNTKHTDLRYGAGATYTICGLFSSKEGNMCPTMPGPTTPALFRLNTVLQCIAILQYSNTFNTMLPAQYQYCNQRAIQSMSASKWNPVQFSAIQVESYCNSEQFSAFLLQSSAMPERYSRVPWEVQRQPIVHWSGGQCLDR